MVATEDMSVLEGVFTVGEGDDVHLAVHDYEWTNPYTVTDIDHINWRAATADTWATREVLVEGGYGSTFRVDAVEGDDDLDLRKHPGGQKRGDLERFEPVTEDGNEDEDESTDSGTSTEDDTPTTDGNSESEAEQPVDLEEDAADDAPTSSVEFLEMVNKVLDGDDVQEEIVCDCGQTFESQAAYQGHGPKSCEGDDEEQVDLPEGVTENLVDELTSGGIEIGTLADELDVHRNKARWIAHDLGFYERVREVWRDRERAQVDPRVTGLLAVVLGLVPTGIITMGVTLP